MLRRGVVMMVIGKRQVIKFFRFYYDAVRRKKVNSSMYQQDGMTMICLVSFGVPLLRHCHLYLTKVEERPSYRY